MKPASASEDSPARLPANALDSSAVHRNLARAAHTAPAGDFLYRETAQRMSERLDYIRCTPQRVLDLGCGAGADLATLAARYPQAECLGIDRSPERLAALRLATLRGAPSSQSSSQSIRQSSRKPSWTSRLKQFLHARRAPARILADARSLPLANSQVDLVWSNLLLPWVEDPLQVFREVHRCLRIDGLFLFSSLGPDTLRQLRVALGPQEAHRVHAMIDMHDLGDALVQAGFSDPVMDMEMLTLHYRDPADLLRELRQHGAGNIHAARTRGLTAPGRLAHLLPALEKLRGPEGLPISIELIQGHAWKPTPRTDAAGRAILRFQPRPPS